MFKYIPILLMTVFFSINLLAQKSWTIISQDKEKVIYIDTSSVKASDNNISVMGMIIYFSPQRTNPFQAKATKIRTQFLFNSLTERYTVIGTLYYNEEGKIVGETTNTRISTGADDTFSLPIEENEYAQKVFENVTEYLEKGVIEPKTFDVDTTQIDLTSENELPQDSLISGTESDDTTNLVKEESASVDKDTIKTTEQTEITDFKKQNNLEKESVSDTLTKKDLVSEEDAGKVLKDKQVEKVDTVKAEDFEPLTDKEGKNETEPENTSVQKDDVKNKIEIEGKDKEKRGRKIYDPTTGDYIYVNEEGEPIEKGSTSGIESGEGTKTVNGSYDSSSERMVKQTIFTDGDLYCFQVSSWKTKRKAEAQAQNQRNAGHDAFVISAKVPGRGTWHRVRIGYFETLEETERYMQRHGF